MVGEPVSGMARCPYDPRHANVALFAGSPSLFCLFLFVCRASVSSCLPLQMIYSVTSRCVPCWVLIFVTLCYLLLHLPHLPHLLLDSLSPSLYTSSLTPRWKSLYRHRDGLLGHRRCDLSQPGRQPCPPHGQTRLQVVPRYFF